MDYRGGWALHTIIEERPDTILVSEGANTLDLARGCDRHVQATQAARCRHLGRHGCRRWARPSSPPSRPAIPCWRSKAAAPRLLRQGNRDDLPCKLPVCAVVFYFDGIYRGDGVNTGGGSDPATTAS